MLKRIFIVCTVLLLSNTLFAQLKNANVSPLEYKVNKQYFQDNYIKDAEDKKIAALFDKKRGQLWGLVVATGASIFISNYTMTMQLSDKVVMSPFVPVTLSLVGLSIFKGSRYSRKKKFLYVTGQAPLPNYVSKKIANMK